MDIILGKIQQWYRSCLKAIGRRLTTRRKNTKKLKATHLLIERQPPQSPSDLDGIATRLGDIYRGLGVVVGALSMGIIFCALAPFGLELNELSAHRANYIELVLMMTIVFIFLYVKTSKLHQRWMNSRLLAEQARYASLGIACDRQDIPNICTELSKNLGEQIQYNLKKHIECESIETATAILIWLAFPCAFLAAMAHIFFEHIPWLIFLTAFLPSVGATVHGINSFLAIGELAKEHHHTAHVLKEEEEKLKKAKTTNSDNDILKIGTDVFQIFTEGVQKWQSEIAG